MNIKKFIKILLEHSATHNIDGKGHKQYAWKGFVAVSVYAILYGIYEYLVCYGYVGLVDWLNQLLINPYGILWGNFINWFIMTVGLLLLVGIVTRYRLEQMIFGLLYMVMLEDLAFWMTWWIDKGTAPYPAYDWWSHFFASFRVLGYIGQPIPFWPYIPVYYIPGFAMAAGFYLGCMIGPKMTRIYSWLAGPIFLATLFGTLGNDTFAKIILIALPIASYIYLLWVLLRQRKSWTTA